MTVGVSHTFGGNVVVVDLDTGKRWDLTPDMAERGAAQCTVAAAKASFALVVMAALDGRSYRFAGSREDAIKMASDLMVHAAEARAKRETGLFND